MGNGAKAQIALSRKWHMHGIRQIKKEGLPLKARDPTEEDLEPWETVKLGKATTDDVAVEFTKRRAENLQDAPNWNDERFKYSPEQARCDAAVPHRVLPATPQHPGKNGKIIERNSVLFDNTPVNVRLVI